jgi:hypothetical protein
MEARTLTIDLKALQQVALDVYINHTGGQSSYPDAVGQPDATLLTAEQYMRCYNEVSVRMEDSRHSADMLSYLHCAAMVWEQQGVTP